MLWNLKVLFKGIRFYVDEMYGFTDKDGDVTLDGDVIEKVQSSCTLEMSLTLEEDCKNKILMEKVSRI